ncbi:MULTISPECIES: thioredoxin family protein [Pontibacillus]|uniref:Thioredoxin family protein n=1 Tax=Pontibacillus chungwhensis TaxID=265426 RepID=A0ABY8V3Y7_9BACI|nr:MULTISPECIES: thioredoxin family protein [Pontibacillus]MCD5325431.1 thioredoxin family protein [Pontibacillus sp. HN14]WIF98546.1 thioredoxin family protein [Pontibacillus chungwhensis]
MKHVHTMDEIHSTIGQSGLNLLYISRPGCSVCHALLPQIDEVLERYPAVEAVHADADEIPEIAGEFSIFTVPVVMVYADGKEQFRKARFVPVDEFEDQLGKLYRLIHE